MAMGIDQEIQRRMDAYRGNPQGLQQRYQMSQQLIDLLALQKLKAEKDAVARQMQAQMQQTPGTVAQQMEQEMVGRTKQELVQQTAGIMQQKARQQQQGVQRMAQAAARSQGGIGALAPRNARPSPRMAGGGIVAFKRGGLTDREIGLMSNEELVQAAAEGRISEEAAQQEIRDRVGRTPLERAEDFSGKIDARGEELFMRKLPGAVGDVASAVTGIGAAERGVASIPGAIGSAIQSAYEYATTPTKESVPPTPPVITAATPEKPEPEEDKAAEPGARGRDMGGLGVLLPGETVESGAQPKKAAAPAGGIDAPRINIGALGGVTALPSREDLISGIATLRGTTPEAARAATMEAYSKAAGTDKVGQMYKDISSRLAELDRAQMDPKALRRERLMASLIGAAGKSTFGLTGAGAAAGAENTRQQQRIAERQRLVERLGLEKEGVLKTSQMGADSFTQGMKAFEQAAQDQRAGLKAAFDISDSDRDAYDAAAKRQVDALIAQGKLDSEAIGQRLKQVENAIESRRADQEFIVKSFETLDSIIGENREALLAEKPRLVALQQERAYKGLSEMSETEILELENLERDFNNQLNARLSAIGDEAGVDILGLRNKLLARSQEVFATIDPSGSAIVSDTLLGD